jgi:hypothetical protein
VLLRVKSPVTVVSVVSTASLSVSAIGTPAANAAGWNNASVVVSFTCLGGVGGVATCPAPILVSTEGANQTISGTATDTAGNSKTATLTLNIDKTNPVVTASVIPAPNAAGWNNAPVTVNFTCSDSGSGISQCPTPISVTTDGTQTVSGTATDIAGNTATASAVVKIDRAAPTITAVPSPAPNAAGWNRSAVTVNYNCADALSGIGSCPGPNIIVAEGGSQSVTRTAQDQAGNTATASATVNLDETPPVLTITSPGNGLTVSTASQTISGTVIDALSGVNGVTCAGVAATIASGTFTCTVSLTRGTNSIAVNGTDIAGNQSTATATVIYSPAPNIRLTLPGNLSYLNISPTTVTGTVDDGAATVVVNNVAAAVGNGQFSLSLPLQEGPNLITAAATNTSGAVGTATLSVTLDTTPPHVTITSPQDQFVTTDASISISGNVNDIVVGTVNDQQAQVTVNGVAANVANRTFLATNVPLIMGNNTIQAVGRDRAGNAATTQITVIRQAPAAQPQIRLISGNNQTGIIGSILGASLVVALVDAVGNPVPNQTVLFKVTQNNGLLASGGAPAASVATTTDTAGRAQAQWTLGLRSGAGGNTVEAYAVGFGGTAIFTGTGTQGPAATIVIDSGNNQIGVVNQALPKPLIAVVVDSGSNRLANIPVTFSVQQGGGSFGGQQSVIVNSDSDGRVAATLTLGYQEGNANNLVVAIFPGSQSVPASFTASGRAAGDPASTTITGVVLDNSNLPIPGVTIRAVLTNLLNSNSSAINAAATVQSDAQGQFAISPAPVGYVKLLVDGSTAQRPGKYPSLDYDMVTISGQTNTLGMPVYLLPLNPANQLCVTASTGGGTLTMPEAPGFSLTFSPGQVTFPGGSKEGCVSVTMVHGDKVPMVPGFGQQPRFIVTIQPAGALFNPPAAITIPNVDGLAPRSVTEMYSFDHDIGSFVAIGTGVVSDDGSVIASAKGVGVLKAGWHCGGNPAPADGTVADCPDCQVCVGNQCKPKFTNDQCCQTASGSPLVGSDAAGFVACCNGAPVACLNGNHYPDGGSLDQQIERACAALHEQTHMGQASCPTGPSKCDSTPLTIPPADQNRDECAAYTAQVNCLFGRLIQAMQNHTCDNNCQTSIEADMIGLIDTANSNFGQCFSPTYFQDLVHQITGN